jgi:hypothetical protein
VLADRRAWAHSAGGAVQTGFEIQSEFKWFRTFSTVSNFDRLEKYFPLLRKIEVKDGFEALEEGDDFLYRNFLRFRMDLELTFRGVCMN